MTVFRKSRVAFDVHHAVELYSSGLSLNSVSRQIGTTPKTIKRRFTMLGIKLEARHSGPAKWTEKACLTCFVVKAKTEFWKGQKHCKACYTKAPEIRARRRLAKLRKYGLTQQQYDQMLAEQKNSCAICGAEFEAFGFVDHCHRTNNVRGLLCSTCNSVLGMAKDSEKILLRAVEYLRKYGSL